MREAAAIARAAPPRASGAGPPGCNHRRRSITTRPPRQPTPVDVRRNGSRHCSSSSMTLIVEEYLKKSTEKAGDASTGNQLACVENLTRALAANKDSQSVYRASPFVD